MFKTRRWFVILQGLTMVCMVLALIPLPAFGAPLGQSEAPQAENPPPEPPSSPTPEVDATEGAGPTHTIYLKSRQFAPVTSELSALRQIASTTTQARMHVLLQLDFIPRQAARDALAAEGIELLAYVPDYTWIASVPTARVPEVPVYPGVAWVGQLQVQDKLDPAIVKEQWGPYNLTPDGIAAVYVVLHGDESLDTVAPWSHSAVARLWVRSRRSISWSSRCRALTSRHWRRKRPCSGSNRPRRR